MTSEENKLEAWEIISTRRLNHWFRFDHLDPMQGIALLIGLDAEKYCVDALVNWGGNQIDDENALSFGLPLLDGDEIGGSPPNIDEEYLTQDVRESFLEEERDRFRVFVRLHSQLLEYWHSGKHPECTPLAYFIDWGLSKSLFIEWLELAVKTGKYSWKQEAESMANLKTAQPEHSDLPHAKWRKAFEYESEGLNALYDLIERHYFDADGKPIYDPAQWSLKKNLVSDWLRSRTLDEADTIITSGNRKGKAEK